MRRKVTKVSRRGRSGSLGPSRTWQKFESRCAALEFAGEVANSRCLRIRSVNRVFPLTLTGLSPIFPLASVLSAGGQSRLCASLRPLRGAKNAVLTNLPLRSVLLPAIEKM